SQTSGFVAAFFEASKNSKRPSANTSPSTMKIPSRSYGSEPPTRFSPASLASLSAPLPRHIHDLCHEPMGQETSGKRRSRGPQSGEIALYARPVSTG